jgi:predicted nucleic acid-binding protein
MSAETSMNGCFVDSNIWLCILLPGQDVRKAEEVRELVRSKNTNIVSGVPKPFAHNLE